MTDESTEETRAEITLEELHAHLRSRAQGGWASEASTELLIQIDRAYPTAPWISHQHYTEGPDSWWIEWSEVPDNIGYMSGGERRIMELAASIGGDHRVDVGEIMSGLDGHYTTLALAAITRASGRPWPL